MPGPPASCRRAGGLLTVLVALVVSACSGTPSAPTSAPTPPAGSSTGRTATASADVAGPTSPVPSTPATSTPSATPAPTTPAGTSAGRPPYAVTIAPIGPDLAARMTPTSYRAGCPVALADLRHLTVTYVGFDGAAHTGELVVAASVAPAVGEVFRTLYAAGYPIRSMRLVDDFGGSDDASMAADNTSAFNCRAVTGGGGFSQHSYGTAIDLNPRENPYVSGSTVLPPEGAAYVGRPAAPGVILAGDATVQAFAAAGFRWGGYWTSPKDYQHFSTTGR